VTEYGVRLDLKSQMLYTDDCIYMNGEAIETEPDTFEALHELANHRQLSAGQYDESLLETLFTYYEYGYLIPSIPKSAD
jgi:50S ribosomal protein L16 3-hydroxylase